MSGKFWLNFVLIIVSCGMIDLVTYSYNTLFMKNITGTLMVLVNERNGLNDRIDLPENVEQYLRKYDVFGTDNKEVRGVIVPLKFVNEDYQKIENGFESIDIRNKDKKMNPYVANLVVDELTPKNIKVESSKPSPKEFI
jgi:hypothetical protein